MEAWREALGITPPSLTAHFFDDLGGSSLAALRVHARLVRELRYDLPLAVLFTYPTISALAAHLRDSIGGFSAKSALIAIGGSTVRDTPTAPLVVFVHPAGGSVLCFAPLAAQLRARSCTVIAMGTVAVHATGGSH